MTMVRRSAAEAAVQSSLAAATAYQSAPSADDEPGHSPIRAAALTTHQALRTTHQAQGEVVAAAAGVSARRKQRSGICTHQLSEQMQLLMKPARYSPTRRSDYTDRSSALTVWSGFFRKTFRERQDQLNLVFPEFSTEIIESGGLSCSAADVMVENCIGSVAIPLGIAPTFFVNGIHYVVPMAVEEPSVIAAASGAAKLVSRCGGFSAESTGNIMIGQIQVLDVEDLERAVEIIDENRQLLIEEGSRFCQSMQERGGGVIDVFGRIVRPRRARRNALFKGALVVHVHMDVCEAMGANAVNAVAEGLSPTISELVNGRGGLKILSNLCLERRTKARLRIPTQLLAWKGVPGSVVAQRIVEAFEYADADSFRATTHNKGIMNGVDAVALACGQDWRAIESAAHAYASRRGYYAPLSEYEIVHDASLEDHVLVGTLELPLSVGVKGGAILTHPAYKNCLDLMGNPSARELAQVITSVGLAQNFAALRALAVEGIQKGHMELHARNIAVAAGVCHDLVNEVASYMSSRGNISQSAAKEYLKARSIP